VFHSKAEGRISRGGGGLDAKAAAPDYLNGKRKRDRSLVKALMLEYTNNILL
jgi:hypothetical protein